MGQQSLDLGNCSYKAMDFFIGIKRAPLAHVVQYGLNETICLICRY